MIKKTLFCLLIAIAITAKSQNPFPSPFVVSNIDWIRYYSQVDILNSAPTTIDVNSNVYTTGYRGITGGLMDLLVMKYDSTGVQTFSYTYNNGGDDEGRAIKIDAAGNSYIAGMSDDVVNSKGKDYIIIKLSPTGSLMWMTPGRFDASGKDDIANDICVDGNGDVYVTGQSQNSNGDFDIVTLKIDGTTGLIIWQHSYGSPGSNEIGKKMVLSSDGQRVFITGHRTSAATGKDIVTYGLDANTSAYLWTPVSVITNGPSNGDDQANDIILSGSNILVCGEIDNTVNGTGMDYVTIKYDGSTGSVLWQQDYDAYNNNDRATSLARDSTGNIGVVGIVDNFGFFEYHTVLYDSMGARYGVNIESTGLSGVTVDPKICNDTIAHHWYVCGEALKVTKDIYVYQITPGGNTSWREHIDGQNHDVDAATGIDVNGVGVVYVGALSKNSSADYDYTTIKINQTPCYWPPDYNNEPVNPNHLYFANKGQIMRTDSVLGNEMLYYTHHTKPSVFIEQKGFNFIFNRADTIQNTLDSIERIQYEFIGHNTHAGFHEYLSRGAVHNYYLGYAQLPAIENLRGNERVFIPNYYPYIDLHYFSGSGGIKYYLVVKPGAFLGELRMRINGAEQTEINAAGDMFIEGALGDVILKEPIAYTVNWLGQVVNIPGATSWASYGSDTYGIVPPSGYNTALPLIIQVAAAPMGQTASANITGTNLEYSTYYGGQGNEVFKDVKALPNGNRYITGYTNAATFPAANSLNFYNGNFDAVILKYTADDSLRYATFQGGSSMDMAETIATDSHENVFIGGLTLSMDMLGFNVTGATNQFNNGAPSASSPYKQDGFLCKLSSSPPGQLVWRRYFGGSHSDAVNSIYIDGSDNLYVAGYSYSTNFPVVNAFKSTGCATTTANPANRDAIFGKFNSSLAAQWITYYGGSANATSGTETQDSGNDIVVDNGGNVYGCGYTDATNLYTINNTGQTNTFFKNSISGQSDGFLVRYNAWGTPDFSSYFGGSNSDGIDRLAFKSWPGEIYFAGTSFKGTGFPFYSKPGAFNSQYSLGGSTAFVGYLDVNLNQQWCTYWGKGQTMTKRTSVTGLSVDNDDLVYLSGWTTTDTLNGPSSAPTTVVYTDSVRNGEDGFIAIFSPFKTLYHAHYFGGNSDDRINNTDVSYGQKLYVVGEASSVNFPIAYSATNATLIDSTANGGQDGFISRFDLENYQVTSIQQADFDQSMLLLYPNPANTRFNIDIEGMLNSRPMLCIYNIMGQIMLEEEIQDSKTQINCESWTNGVYLINIRNTESSTTFKLIKH